MQEPGPPGQPAIIYTACIGEMATDHATLIMSTLTELTVSTCQTCQLVQSKTVGNHGSLSHANSVHFQVGQARGTTETTVTDLTAKTTFLWSSRPDGERES